MKKNIVYRILRPFLVFYIKLFYKPKIIGIENIPKSGGVILVANHKSDLDFISMGVTTKRSVCFMAKHTLFKGVLKPILKGAGVISVNRTIKDKSVIPQGLKVLREGSVLGIFPEGTFNKTKEVLAPFKIGAVKLAYESKCPIMPIAIGDYKRKKLRIKVGKKFFVNSDDLELENERLMNELKKIITDKEV